MRKSTSLHGVTRLRLDAALYGPAPERRAGQPGRPRKKGQRLPTLAQVLADSATGWTPLTLPRWYSQGEQTVEIVGGTAVWYHGGKPPVPIRWVLVRDPRGCLEPQALLCTHPQATARAILAWFIQRWLVEVTFEEVHAHLGVETQRLWQHRSFSRSVQTTHVVKIPAVLLEQLTEALCYAA